jgi:HAD superfamily hydrolase (TIGR01459 family)
LQKHKIRITHIKIYLKGFIDMLLEEIEKIDVILDRYDAVICDIWGVLHNGITVYQDAVAALRRAKAKGKHVILLTNAPKRSDVIQQRFKKMGVADAFWDATLTSGDCIAQYLAENAQDQAIFHWGQDDDKGIYQDHDFNLTTLDKADMIVCTGLIDSVTEISVNEAAMLAKAADRKLPFICANPDKSVKIGDDFQLCAGALADIYLALNMPVDFFGKPHPIVYHHCLHKLEALSGNMIHQNKILAIGDGLYTDIKGAQNANIDCLMVLNGLHQELFQTSVGYDFTLIREVCEAHDVRPEYYMPYLR